jgi:hypothetical protein
MGRPSASVIDVNAVNAYRERVAGSIGMEVRELIASRRDHPTAVLLRMSRPMPSRARSRRLWKGSAGIGVRITRTRAPLTVA